MASILPVGVENAVCQQAERPQLLLGRRLVDASPPVDFFRVIDRKVILTCCLSELPQKTGTVTSFEYWWSIRIAGDRCVVDVHYMSTFSPSHHQHRKGLVAPRTILAQATSSSSMKLGERMLRISGSRAHVLLDLWIASSPIETDPLEALLARFRNISNLRIQHNKTTQHITSTLIYWDELCCYFFCAATSVSFSFVSSNLRPDWSNSRICLKV